MRSEIKTVLKDDNIKPNKGMFFDGQTYDAYVFINDLLKSAKNNGLHFPSLI